MKFALGTLIKRQRSHTRLESKKNPTYNFWAQFANFNLTIEFAHVEPTQTPMHLQNATCHINYPADADCPWALEQQLMICRNHK